jgi:glycosyltransferase involved in cell wall biosynthesis
MHSISVIIPAYNREAYVADAIESALRQTLPPGEVIVVNDGSTDRTAEIARSYGEKVRCISQENLGCGAARNTGLNEARGNLIAFLDSDDIWLDQKLEVQSAYLADHPETDMVFCHMKPFLSPEINPADALKFDPREIVACNACALLAPRHAFAKAGPFPSGKSVAEFIPWFSGACDAGLTHHILPELFLLRRVHLTNSVHNPEIRSSYMRFLKQRLDRARNSSASSAESK